MADPIKIEMEFPDDTGPLSSSWSGLAGIAKDIRDSWKSIDEEMTGTIKKAEELRTKLSLKDDVLAGIKTMLGEITTSINTNDATLRSSLQTLNQIMANSNNVNSVMGRANNFDAQTNQGFSNPLAAPMAYAAAANEARQSQIREFSTSDLKSQFADVNNPSFFNTHTRIMPSEADLGGNVHSARTGNEFGEVLNPSSPTFESTGRRDGLVQESKQSPGGGFVAEAPTPINMSASYPNLAKYWTNPKTGESLLNANNFLEAPNMAAQGLINSMQRGPLGMVPGMGNIIGALAPVLQGSLAFASAGQSSLPAGSDINNFFTKLQQSIMNGMNSLGNKLSGALTSNAALRGVGAAQIGLGTYNAVTSAQNAYLQSVTYPAQGLADITGGNVSPGSYGLLKAKSLGYMFNTKYSPNDYLAAQYAARQLGLTGQADANAYQGYDQQLQTQYGLTHGETQQVISTGLAYGMNINPYVNGLESARTQANAIGKTNLSYTMGTYQLGNATAASLGYGSSAQVAFGSAAAKFGAGNQIAQAAGMTGQELMGTTLGTALFAQQAGVSFMDSFSAAQNMGASKALKIQDNAMLGLLQKLGIPVNSINKPSDLNPYAIKLGIILPQLGITDVSTPQQAVVWAFTVISRAKGIGAGTSSNLINQWSGASLAGGPTGGPTGSGSSGGLASKPMVSAQAGGWYSSYANDQLMGALSGGGLSSTSGTSATTANGVTVTVSLAAGVQNLLNASVTGANSANTSSGARITQNAATN